MLKTRNIENLGCEVAALVDFAIEHGFIGPNVPDEFDHLLLLAREGVIERRELEKLIAAVQAAVKLPAYTIRQAAAWLGLTPDGVSSAIREGRLPAVQPGHDWLLWHHTLTKYAERRLVSTW